MEKTEFPQKVIAFEQSYPHQIERLLEIGTEVSKFWASVTSWVSHFFITLNQIILQEMSFIARVCNLSITRFASLPPLDLWLRRTAPQVEEAYPSTEMERANISFVLNLTAARKIVSDLTKRVAVQTPRSLFLFSPPSGLPEAEFLQERVETPVKEPAEMPAKEPLEAHLEKPLEEPLGERARTVLGVAADLPSRFESKLASSIKGLTSAVQEYSRQKIWLTPLLTMPKPVVSKVPARVETLPRRPQVARSEYVTPQAGLPKEPLLERKEAPAEPEPQPQISMPTVELNQKAAKTFMHAAELPSILFGMETALSLSTTATPSPLPLPQITRLIEGASPSLTSWIYGESEVLRRTGLSLSVVPIAAATAEKIVTETLVQPTSSFEAPLPPQAAGSVPTGLPTFRPETIAESAGYKTFRLPAMLVSLMVAQGQKYPLFLTEPSVSQVYEASAESTQIATEKTAAPSGMLVGGRGSKLPTVIALAAAESLIAQRLQLEFGSLVKELHVPRSSYVEAMSDLGSVGPVRTTMLGRLAEVAPGVSPALAPFRPMTPSVAQQPPLARPSPLSPPSPPVQNAFNITVSGERTEEDLRDLERKISQIISEQVRRYYGSTKI